MFRQFHLLGHRLQVYLLLTEPLGTQVVILPVL